MFSIVESLVYREEEEYSIAPQLNADGRALEVDFSLPANRKVGLALVRTGVRKSDAVTFYKTGERAEIPLQNFSEDSFTLKVSDEDGKPMAEYYLMRCFC